MELCPTGANLPACNSIKNAAHEQQTDIKTG